MSPHRTLLPPEWPRPKGYANGILAEGRTLWTGGVVGWDEQERFPDADMAGQFRRILESTRAILAEGGAGPEHIVRMTWYITDRQEYLDSLPAIGGAYREIIGRHFPVMAVVQVVALLEAAAKIEIETTAVIPAEKSHG